ncbi:hypothetical protein L13192_01004 [Pyrenophora tritici-repentis]|uniref:Uncharacterized protein n=2 Tax=Pyrenophora tritici-repentis TaxID=45151 RepID=A0A922NCW5_9PLEO|nr:uncharacterized protein PTRG_01496 [Pyrenophora tritici-repentis Pt-1C-BFP]EDU40934.1 predicted protein [Pyrenophora tritici-repentis Pt-1C-BFP]KAI1513621.1 hypothetical protein Ptr86124_007523 [Pyrenophora tritici-repentis]KAI1674257.1 hypothetical protein L13192_01004 [Pyrenophora tritici-repentis]KAI1688633.1 hypothetical protein KJE20_01811 [Pyrenophora tritici-repentis]
MNREESPAQVEAKFREILSEAPLTLDHIRDSIYPFSIGSEDTIETVFEYMVEQVTDKTDTEAEKYGLVGYNYGNSFAKSHDSPDMELEDEEPEDGYVIENTPDVVMEGEEEENYEEDYEASEDSEELPGNDNMEGITSPTLSDESLPSTIGPSSPHDLPNIDEDDIIGITALDQLNNNRQKTPSPPGGELPNKDDWSDTVVNTSPPPSLTPSEIEANFPALPNYSSSLSGTQVPSSPPVIPSSLLAGGSLSPPPTVPGAQVGVGANVELKTSPAGSKKSSSPLSDPGSILKGSTPTPPPVTPTSPGGSSSTSTLSSPRTIPTPSPSSPPATPTTPGGPSSTSSLSSPRTIPTPSPSPPAAGTKRAAPTTGGQPRPKRVRNPVPPARKQTAKVAKAGQVVLQCTGQTRRGARCGFTKQMPQGTQTWDCGRHNR